MSTKCLAIVLFSQGILFQVCLVLKNTLLEKAVGFLRTRQPLIASWLIVRNTSQYMCVGGGGLLSHSASAWESWGCKLIREGKAYLIALKVIMWLIVIFTNCHQTVMNHLRISLVEKALLLLLCSDFLDVSIFANFR